MGQTFTAASTPVVYLGHNYGIGEPIPAQPGELDDLIALGVVKVRTTPDPEPPAAHKEARAPRRAVKKNE